MYIYNVIVLPVNQHASATHALYIKRYPTFDQSTMRRKRLQHHTDIFCDMFAGWKIVNDMKSLVELESGIIEFDFLNRTQKLNNSESKTDFNMFYEISEWFADDLKKHNIEAEFIKEAKVKAEFKVEFKTGKKKSRTKGITELYLNLNSWILTDEKEYKSEKELTQEFHHIERKEKTLGNNGSYEKY